MVMTVVVMIVMVMIGCGTALTGRLRRHSAAGLTVVPAAVLPLADLDQVVGHHHPQLRGKWRVVRAPVGKSRSQAGLWSWFMVRHVAKSRDGDRRAPLSGYLPAPRTGQELDEHLGMGSRQPSEIIPVGGEHDTPASTDSLGDHQGVDGGAAFGRSEQHRPRLALDPPSLESRSPPPSAHDSTGASLGPCPRTVSATTTAGTTTSASNSQAAVRAARARTSCRPRASTAPESRIRQDGGVFGAGRRAIPASLRPTRPRGWGRTPPPFRPTGPRGGRAGDVGEARR